MFLKINRNDNCAVALEEISKGFCENGITANDSIPFGHKIAVEDIKKGENIIKYGHPIGHATKEICKGDWLHSYNVSTNLTGTLDYSFSGENEYTTTEKSPVFNGFLRSDGRVGIRNELVILSTVGCVNKTVERIFSKANKLYSNSGISISRYTHPYGCSQLGDDYRYTQKALKGIILNGNVGGVLLVSLGCENNNLDEFLPTLKNYDKDRIRPLVVQDVENEIDEALKIIGEIAQILKNDKRTPLPLSKLTVGYKCGGSDAFSGITANPLCGFITDKIVSFGGRAILTEVPEMFGAEQILMKRAENEAVFKKMAGMINSFKNYFVSYGQSVSENPSPGNKKGGITTLEEKSLGCVAKGGNAVVTDVLSYGEKCTKSGLSLLTGPGNDIVSCTNLAASGANLILFTTGRGTPLGSVVPTIKISSNTELFRRKPNWIDFDAGKVLSGISFEELRDELFEFIIKVANGEETKNEINDEKEIAIFKDGVTL